MTKLKLETSNATFKRLHDIADTRGLQKQIRKAELLGLLIDHSRMVARLEEQNTEIDVR